MKVVTQFVAEDGRAFTTKAEALRWERVLPMKPALIRVGVVDVTEVLQVIAEQIDRPLLSKSGADLAFDFYSDLYEGTNSLETIVEGDTQACLEAAANCLYLMRAIQLGGYIEMSSSSPLIPVLRDLPGAWRDWVEIADDDGDTVKPINPDRPGAVR